MMTALVFELLFFMSVSGNCIVKVKQRPKIRKTMKNDVTLGIALDILFTYVGLGFSMLACLPVRCFAETLFCSLAVHNNLF